MRVCLRIRAASDLVHAPLGCRELCAKGRHDQPSDDIELTLGRDIDLFRFDVIVAGGCCKTVCPTDVELCPGDTEEIFASYPRSLSVEKDSFQKKASCF